MIKIRILDRDGKDEIHTGIKLTFVSDRIWIYTEGIQYYIPTDTIDFFQVWEEEC